MISESSSLPPQCMLPLYRMPSSVFPHPELLQQHADSDFTLLLCCPCLSDSWLPWPLMLTHDERVLITPAAKVCQCCRKV
jgi:hypothetical protein